MIHATFLSLLARRAEQQSQRTFPYRRVSWPVIEAAAFIARSRARRVRTLSGPASSTLLGAVSRSSLGLGWACKRRGAAGRLRAVVAVERAFSTMGDGLRVEELAVLTGIAEVRLWRFLQWCRKNGVYEDRGERGWFRFNPHRTIAA